jgi:hypothetical protein
MLLRFTYKSFVVVLAPSIACTHIYNIPLTGTATILQVSAAPTL